MKRAFLGTGLLGSAFVRAMLKRGAAVSVWNRSAAKAQALAVEGAVVADSAAAAVAGADIVHLALRDDAAVDEVLASAAPQLKPGAIILDHTTTSVDGAVRRTADWAPRGVHYLHVPVLMQPQNALDATGVMLVSGDPAVVEKAMPELRPMAGDVVNLGDQPGAATATKLVTNLYLIAVVSGLSDVLNVAKGTGLSPDGLKSVLGAMDLNALTQGMLDWVRSGQLKDHPAWELTMARKDVGLILDEGAKSGNRMVAMPAAAAEMDRWIADGFGHADWAIFASAGAQ